MKSKTHRRPAPVVRLSPGERFLNWYAGHTKLYIRGQRGKDWDEQRRLDQELFEAIDPWLRGLMEEARKAALEEAAQLIERDLRCVPPIGWSSVSVLRSLMDEIRALKEKEKL